MLQCSWCNCNLDWNTNIVARFFLSGYFTFVGLSTLTLYILTALDVKIGAIVIAFIIIIITIKYYSYYFCEKDQTRK